MVTSANQPYTDLVLRLKEAVSADRCTFYRVDQAKGEVWSVAAIGLEIAEIRLPTRRGLVGFVARTGKTLNLKDAYNDPRFDRSVDARTNYRTKSILTMAIRDSTNHVIGILQALNKSSGVFTPEDEAVMEKTCQEAAELIGRAA